MARSSCIPRHCASLGTRSLGVLAVPLCILMFVPEFAVAVSVQPQLQAKILVRALTFDRALKGRVGGNVTIGIVYSPGSGTSEKAMKGMESALRSLASTQIHGLPHTPVPLAYRSARSLEAQLEEQGVDVIYICPDVDIHLQTLVKLSYSKEIPTLTGTPSYVEAGVALGVGVKANKPKLLVNLDAAKKTGMNLSSLLMRVADIVG